MEIEKLCVALFMSQLSVCLSSSSMALTLSKLDALWWLDQLHPPFYYLAIPNSTEPLKMGANQSYQSKLGVYIRKDEDPLERLKAEREKAKERIAQAKEGELELVVVAAYVGVVQANRTVEALKQLNESKWRLQLWLQNNELESVPELVYDLYNLDTLGLNNNKLSSLSPSLAKLSKLKWLGLDSNRFPLIPPCVGQLPLLERLCVYGESSLVVRSGVESVLMVGSY